MLVLSSPWPSISIEDMGMGRRVVRFAASDTSY